MGAKNDSVFINLLNALEKSGDLALAYQFQKQQNSLLLMKEQLVEEVVQEVLSRISVRSDVTEAVARIDTLEQAIERLGK